MNRSERWFLFVAFLALCIAALFLLRPQVEASELLPPGQTISAPEFPRTDPADWLNSPPLRLVDLKGKVVLLDVWTFGCWNCYRSFPWLNTLESRLKDKGLQVVGIHSPEFDRERDLAALKRKAKEFHLDHPIMVDNDLQYWHALGNRYWPAYYLIDKQGHIRARFYGETHVGDPQAKRIEATLETLLAEK